MLEVGNPHLTIGGIIKPLKQDPRDQGMCSLDIMFQRNPHDELLGKPERVSHDDVRGVVYAAIADCRHLAPKTGTHESPQHGTTSSKGRKWGGVHRDHIRLRHMCPVEEQTTGAPQEEHAGDHQADATHLRGPHGTIHTSRKRRYRYVRKFTDDYSRMKEVYLLRNKFEAAESLHQYNMTLAVPLELRIEIVRCDKAGEYIGKELKTLCVNAGINVEYTATNMPQQNGVSERDGQTLAQITRCLMKDGNFPPSLWGELIFTAVYLSNSSPHSALRGATPYFRMYNKEADLSGLPAIGARAFVHSKTYTRKLDDRAFEGKLCRFSQDRRVYRIYNPAKGTVVESLNVIFLETPAYSLPLGVTSKDFHHEGDVLQFTSAMDGPLMAEDTFDGEDFCSAMEQEARTQRLRQEVRRLSRMNATYRELPTSPQPPYTSPGVASENSGGSRHQASCQAQRENLKMHSAGPLRPHQLR